MARDGWIAERVREFGQLRGQHITAWMGVEMALREEIAAGGPQFEDPSVPCLQLLTLGASLSDGTFVTVGTYQDDSAWGLWLRRAASDYSADRAGMAGTYRMRTLSELPTGEVDGVSTFLDEEILAEVVLHVQGRPLLLMAGELYESAQQRLVFTRCDESVLVFTDLSAAESVDWVPERRELTQG
ncbi:hypothetical protein Pen02_83070 [Plantactinospora endophytica]|uniref:Uncharacterized protein n=1 Tax=Plantactinospora endophytica TaxID=673535 RepID=A0ABQ4EF73_9ACTN|nr:hypothetical protein [Plantactinospora endophytica]GIG93371.1 hypothetical protein Pen02_83070 [Plantactinospora endophytica]